MAEPAVSEQYDGETDYDKFMKKRRTYLDLTDILLNVFQELKNKFPEEHIVLSGRTVCAKDIIAYTDKNATFNI